MVHNIQVHRQRKQWASRLIRILRMVRSFMTKPCLSSSSNACITTAIVQGHGQCHVQGRIAAATPNCSFDRAAKCWLQLSCFAGCRRASEACFGQGGSRKQIQRPKCVKIKIRLQLDCFNLFCDSGSDRFARQDRGASDSGDVCL
jgi:hypothetical protein